MSGRDDAFADQLLAVYAEVGRYGSPAFSNDEICRAKVDKLMAVHREAMDSGGPRAGRRKLTAMQFRGLGQVQAVTFGGPPPLYDERNPLSTVAPRIVWSTIPENVIYVGSPGDISSVLDLLLGQMETDFSWCDWHRYVRRPRYYDWVDPRDRPEGCDLVPDWSLLGAARGEFLCVFSVCAACRVDLESEFRPGALRWLGQAPDARPLEANSETVGRARDGR